ncbi:MAG: hypothetical protein NTX49_07740 [Chlamydiae bacterium]|nr:hypothetical protein [Chlamydiota bacterium]
MEQMKELRGKVASLESKVDLLEAELIYLNEILTRCGFPEGIMTLKSTVEELLHEGIENPLHKKSQNF